MQPTLVMAWLLLETACLNIICCVVCNIVMHLSCGLVRELSESGVTEVLKCPLFALLLVGTLCDLSFVSCTSQEFVNAFQGMCMRMCEMYTGTR